MRLQFLFSQLWYPMFSFFMALMFAMPIIALLRGENFVEVTYPAFLAHMAPLSLVLVLMAYRWRASKTFRPVDAKILSWEATLFLFARWPWALLGTVSAIRDWLTGSFVDFRVTPKGAAEADPLPFRVLAPYGLLSLASTIPVLIVDNAGGSRGFYLFALINAALYSILYLVIVVQHHRENIVRKRPWIHRPGMAVGMLALVLLPGVAAAERGRDGLEALSWGAVNVQLFQNRYSIAGAGMGGPGLRKTIFAPKWIRKDVSAAAT